MGTPPMQGRSHPTEARSVETITWLPHIAGHTAPLLGFLAASLDGRCVNPLERNSAGSTMRLSARRSGLRGRLAACVDF